MGKIRWRDFDISSPESQQGLYDFCQELRASDKVKNGNVKCWIENFKEWAETQDGG